MNYLDTLNPEQREAVEHVAGPLMIIAGPGSGKTRVLTMRIAHLMEMGVPPYNILALTFTNKAAKEMRERIEALQDTNARSLYMGTFHSVFARILRHEADKLGYTRDFTIYDTQDSRGLIKSIIQDLKLDDKVYRVASVHERISQAKNNLISWQEYANDPEIQEYDQKARQPHRAEIYKRYQQRCFKANAMDFDDLLFNMNLLLALFSEVKERYQDQFQFIMVDEFQDTNICQYKITRTLAEKSRNICVVGDDAQSIYSFRGATIQNILNFERDYPDAKVVRLEQNYRSTDVIVSAANDVIQKNMLQIPKTVWTDRKGGERIHVSKCANDVEEARMVCNSIYEERTRGVALNEFAILYRTNAQSRVFEEALRKLNIKYKVIGGLSFYQRKEIKDLIGYMRFVLNPKDEEALKRIINYPKRSIGEATINQLFVFAFDNDISIWDALMNANKFFKGRVLDSLNQFTSLIQYFQAMVVQRDAFEAASIIAKDSKLLKELYEDTSVEGRSRYENVQELLNAIKDYTVSKKGQDASLGSFLQEVSLLTNADEAQNQEEAVSLMTIHSAKGLEFKNVYVVGLEEGLFPSQQMSGSQEDMEEERRLYYVAITRAKEKLFLSFAIQRYKFGTLHYGEASRFVREMNSAFLKMSTHAGQTVMPKSVQLTRTSPQVRNLVSQQQVPTHRTSENFVPSDTSKLQAGMRVEHAKFGFGKVLQVEKAGADRKATILFDNFGQKTLILSFAKLMIVAS